MRKEELQTLTKGLTNALSGKLGRNYLNSQLFQYLTGQAPIFYADSATDYLENAYSFNPDVYAVVSAMTIAESAVPPIVYAVKNRGKAKEYKRLKYIQRSGSSMELLYRSKKLKAQAFEEVPSNNDLNRLIARPNPLQAWPEFIQNLMGFKHVTGNGYVHGVELSDGRFGEMWVMPPQLTRIEASRSVESLISSYIIMMYGYLEKIPPETVMHIKHWNPDYTYPGSHLYGMSPLKAARRSTMSSNDGRVALSRALKNNGAAGMAFPDDPNIDSIPETERLRLQNFFNKRAGGPEAYKQILVTATRMGWVPFGMSPVDLEIIEAGKMSLRDICNVYLFPSELLNDPDNKTNSNKKESRKQLYLDVVIPNLETLYSELNRWLVPRFNKVDNVEYFIDYDVSGIEALSEDMKNKAEWLNTAYWLTPNEKRQEMNFERLDQPMYDEPWVSMGTVPASQVSGDPAGLNKEQQRLLEQEYKSNGIISIPKN